MTKFQAQPLKVLDWIYRFVGGLRGVREVDLASPIQLVHDVANEAEYATGRFVELNVAQVVLAGTTDRTTLTRAALVLQQNVIDAATEMKMQVGDLDFWLIALDLLIDVDANFVDAIAGFLFAGPTYVGLQPWLMFYASTQRSATPIINGGDLSVLRASSPQITFPLYWPAAGGAGLSFAAVAEAAGVLNTDWLVLLWVGPKGSRPPQLL